jgi:hypothetical protein
MDSNLRYAGTVYPLAPVCRRSANVVTSQLRDTEVRLPHRWRENKFELPDPRCLLWGDVTNGGGDSPPIGYTLRSGSGCRTLGSTSLAKRRQRLRQISKPSTQKGTFGIV